MRKQQNAKTRSQIGMLPGLQLYCLLLSDCQGTEGLTVLLTWWGSQRGHRPVQSQ